MKKKILFIMPSMFIGGAERSLLGMLANIDYENYDVSLFLYRHEGEFLKFIPKEVHVLPTLKQYQTFDVSIKSLLFSRKFIYGLVRLEAKFALKMHCLRKKEKSDVWMAMQYISKSLLPFLPIIPGKYDVGISYLGIPDVLLKKVNAGIKIAWNHTDYTMLHPDKERDRQIYSKINYIVSVSEQCTKQFLDVYPEFQNKALTIENILNTEFLQQQAEEPIKDFIRNEDEYILLSIGRYSEAKNFDNIPAICKLIIQSGLNIAWYIIGYGSDENLIRRKISEAGMEKHVILLGKKSNPYPYLKRCDLYVQPSRYEGKAVTVREAQVLHKPVAITNFATATSQLQNGYDGVILPKDNMKCAEGLIKLLKDKVLMEQLSDNTYKNDYSNKKELEKLYQILA